MRIRIFDRKSDYAFLGMRDDFIYQHFDDYHTNWLEPPPGVSFEEWLNTLVEILGNHLDIRVATKGLISHTALQLYKKIKPAYPTLHMLHERVMSAKPHIMSHHARRKETLLDQFQGLFNAMGHRISSTRAFDWDVFLNTHWGLCMFGIPSVFQTLTTTVEIARIISYCMANNLRSASLQRLFVIDEGELIYRRSHDASHHIILEYTRLAREFGAGFIIGSQSANISDTVITNSAAKVLLGIGHHRDLSTFSASTGMTAPQSEFALRNLRPGLGIAKDPRWPYPFLLEIPRVVN